MRWGVMLNSTWPSALITSPIWLTGILPSPRWSYSRNASWWVSINCHSMLINQQIFAVWFEVSLAYLELGNLIFVELWSHLSLSLEVFESLCNVPQSSVLPSLGDGCWILWLGKQKYWSRQMRNTKVTIVKVNLVITFYLRRRLTGPWCAWDNILYKW